MTSQNEPDPIGQVLLPTESLGNDRFKVRTATAHLARGLLELETTLFSDPVKASRYLAHKLEAAGLITPEE